MGAEPLFALNIVGFPSKALPMEVLGEILRGGAAVAAEAGTPILGGHSTDFDVPVYGLAVTGRAKVSEIRRNVGAKEGDALVLTKAIGTGILTAALRAAVLAGPVKRLLAKSDALEPGEETAAIASMTRLNRDASRAAARHAVSAGTDVTGYGLLGHLRSLLEGSGVGAELGIRAVPLLPGARRLAAAGVAPKGSLTNLETSRRFVDVAEGVSETDLLLLADAQTSGGLLLSVRESASAELVASLRNGGDAAATRIGTVVPARNAGAGRILVVP
jgi:selenide,water dikinase